MSAQLKEDWANSSLPASEQVREVCKTLVLSFDNVVVFDAGAWLKEFTWFELMLKIVESCVYVT